MSEFDYYVTPSEVIRTIIPYLPEHLGWVLDPCAGQDAFRNALLHRVCWTIWQSFDIQQAVTTPEVRPRDFLTASVDGGYDTIISNPPYSLISEWLPRSFAWKPKRIIYLLPLTALESVGRYKAIWHNSPMPLSKIIIFPRRPSFTGNGKTADRGYGWFCFGEGFSGPAIEWLDPTTTGVTHERPSNTLQLQG